MTGAFGPGPAVTAARLSGSGSETEPAEPACRAFTRGARVSPAEGARPGLGVRSGQPRQLQGARAQMVPRGCPALGEESGLFPSRRPVTECGLERLGLFHLGSLRRQVLRPAVSSCSAGGEKAFTCGGSGGHPAASWQLLYSGKWRLVTQTQRHTDTCAWHLPSEPAVPGGAENTRSRRTPCEFRGGGQRAERCAGTAVPELPPFSVLDPPLLPVAPVHLAPTCVRRPQIQTHNQHTLHCTYTQHSPFAHTLPHTCMHTHMPVPIHTQHRATEPALMNTQTHSSRDGPESVRKSLKDEVVFENQLHRHLRRDTRALGRFWEGPGHVLLRGCSWV